MIIFALLKFAIYPIALVAISLILMKLTSKTFNFKDESFKIIKDSSVNRKGVDTEIQETIQLVNGGRYI